MGYKIKLDTNGTNPNVLKSLCEKGLVDYVAMDLKAPFEKYSEICCAEINTDKIRESIEYLQKSGISHEFRTTFCPELTKEDVVLISENMAKNSEFYLQQYRQVDGGNEPHSREYVELTAELVRQNGGKCTVRGL
jgi:pyruvate formate lyase activating enzyme